MRTRIASSSCPSTASGVRSETRHKRFSPERVAAVSGGVPDGTVFLMQLTTSHSPLVHPPVAALCVPRPRLGNRPVWGSTAPGASR